MPKILRKKHFAQDTEHDKVGTGICGKRGVDLVDEGDYAAVTCTYCKRKLRQWNRFA